MALASSGHSPCVEDPATAMGWNGVEGRKDEMERNETGQLSEYYEDPLQWQCGRQTVNRHTGRCIQRKIDPLTSVDVVISQRNGSCGRI